MKFKLYSLFVLLFTAFALGCMKSAPLTNANQGVIVPTGNYTGNFELVHLNPATQKKDTSFASIALLLNTDFSFSVSGDTTKIQAPSHGTFSIDQTNGLITFVDQTVTKTTNPNAAKKHLNGPFLYSISGQNLNIFGSSDTLYYNYTLSK